jgi:GNAT superfamily N-acetyltransferase
MTSSRPDHDTSSIATMGEAIGRISEQHMVTTFRQLMRGPEAMHEDRFMRLMTGEPHPLANFAVLLDPNDVQLTRRATEPLLDGALPSAAIYPVGTVDPAVEAHLEAQGYVLTEQMPAMAIDIDALPETPLPEDYEFLRIHADQAEAWTQALAVGYDLPPRAAWYFSPLSVGVDVAPDASAQFFAVLHEQQIVCTSLLFLADGLAGIYCVATLPEHRRKGLGAHATAEPLRLARDLGFGVGVLQSSEEGYRVYQRLGFTDFGTIPLYTRTPS